MRKGLENMTKHWISTLLFERDYRFWSFEDIANWFRQNYDYTPAYTLDFVSPLAKHARGSVRSTMQATLTDLSLYLLLACIAMRSMI